MCSFSFAHIRAMINSFFSCYSEHFNYYIFFYICSWIIIKFDQFFLNRLLDKASRFFRGISSLGILLFRWLIFLCLIFFLKLRRLRKTKALRGCELRSATAEKVEEYRTQVRIKQWKSTIWAPQFGIVLITSSTPILFLESLFWCRPATFVAYHSSVLAWYYSYSICTFNPPG